MSGTGEVTCTMEGIMHGSAIAFIIERAKRVHSLFMSIEIFDIYRYLNNYVHSSRFMSPFFPYTQEFYSILEISGKFNVRGS